MIWLEQRLATLLVAAGQGGPSAGRPPHRGLLRELRHFVGEVATREGVTACFAAHDGLPLEFAGRVSDPDALPAMAQAATDAARRAAAVLGLGPLRQLVLVAADHKLAILLVGSLVVGIVAPVSIDLGSLLAS